MSSNSLTSSSNLLAKVKSVLRSLVSNNQFIVVTTSITFYVLVSDDIRISETSKKSDWIFNMLTLIAISIFGAEFILSSCFSPHYLLSFFFFLDLISTASLFLDLTYVSEWLFGGNDAGEQDVSVARASRASKAGSKAGRIIRIIRLLRLLRIFKLYKAVRHTDEKRETRFRNTILHNQADPKKTILRGQSSMNKEGDHTAYAPDHYIDSHDADNSHIAPETRVGKKLTELTTRRVILIVLLMLFVVPQFETDAWFTDMSTFWRDGVDDIAISFSMWFLECSHLFFHTAPSDALGIRTTNNTVNNNYCLKLREEYETELIRYILFPSSLERSRGLASCCELHGGYPTCMTTCESSIALNLDKGWVPFWFTISVEGELETFEYVTHKSVTSWFNILGYRDVGYILENPIDFSTEVREDMDSSLLSIFRSEIRYYSEILTRLMTPWGISDCNDVRDKTYSKGVSLLAVIRCPEELRFNEQHVYSSVIETSNVLDMLKGVGTDRIHGYSQSERYIIVSVIVDIRSNTRLEAKWNICQTFLVCLVLGIGALLFSEETNRIVLKPLERMMNKLQRISENPLLASKLEDDEYRFEQERKRDAAKTLGHKRSIISRIFVRTRIEEYVFYSIISKNSFIFNSMFVVVGMTNFPNIFNNREPLETQILEKTILRLGSLLAVGFGEAGASIISRNLKENVSKPLSCGRRVDAIFSVIRVKNFSMAANILGDSIMIFANRICEIIHGIADEFHGMVVKNTGSSFVLIWKIPTSDRRSFYSDLAILSTSLMNIALRKSPLLAQYSENPAFTHELDKLKKSGIIESRRVIGRIPTKDRSIADFTKNETERFQVKGVDERNARKHFHGNSERYIDLLPCEGRHEYESRYRVQLGFALDAGTSIEGAVGSHLKIEAAYLSHSLNIASKLELACSIYRKNVILTEHVIRDASPEFQSLCRLIDRVVLSGYGEERPMKIYCMDLDLSKCEDLRDIDENFIPRVQNYLHTKHRRETRKVDKMNNSNILTDILDYNDDLIESISLYEGHFRDLFNMAYLNYEAGEWLVAASVLFRTLCIPMRTSRDSSSVVSNLHGNIVSTNFRSSGDVIVGVDTLREWYQQCHTQAHEGNCEDYLIDGPSLALISFMSRSDFVPPSTWNGYRVI